MAAMAMLRQGTNAQGCPGHALDLLCVAGAVGATDENDSACNEANKKRDQERENRKEYRGDSKRPSAEKLSEIDGRDGAGQQLECGIYGLRQDEPRHRPPQQPFVQLTEARSGVNSGGLARRCWA